MESIYNYSLKKLTGHLESRKFKKFNAKQVWSWLYRKKAETFAEMTDLSKSLRTYLEQNFSFELPNIDSVSVSNDGTRKYMFRLFDDNFIEAVLIPEKERMTLCISSQVGCKLNCAFCATAKIGFKRNLKVFEITGQLLKVQQDANKRVTNVVFMGMGEPFDNYENSISAASIFSEDSGLAIGMRKITISTSGLIKSIERFTEEDQRYRLAVSLHTPFDDERSRLMPVNKTNSLSKLLPALKKYAEKSKRKVVFEYVMLNELNDSLKHALKLKELLSELPAKLNLIKFHENPYSEFKCSSEKRINNFYKSFRGVHFPVVIRSSRGEDISAACGQLHLQKNEFQEKK